ncbi:hypothetical protein IFO70_20390 [Phormidium tenue FACHB-886]|nr:hypothetical protein [Phormidium tenue FACHB-886]
MNALTGATQSIHQQVQLAIQDPSKVFTLKTLRGGLLFVVGYLLSPLCWWNDLVFNLPIAYLIGYACGWVYPGSLLPGAIAGYWVTNIVGVLMMQFGVVDVFQGQTAEPKERNLRKDLVSGIVTSTVYTLIILGLVQLKILDVPDLFGGDTTSLSSLVAPLVQ